MEIDPNKPVLQREDRRSASLIALVYVLVAATWILISDRLLMALLPQGTVDQLTYLQTIKGLFFISMTAALIWILIERRLNQVRRVEAAKADSEGRLASFAENLPGMAYIKDSKGQITFIRGSVPVGLGEPSRLVGTTGRGVIPDDEHDLFHERDMEVLRTGKVSQRVETVHLGGRELHYLIHRFPLRGPTGESWVGSIALDVTERTNAEVKIRELARELEAANRQKDRFLSNLSHELRTPVTAIKLWIDVLKTTRIPAELSNIREALEMIENSANSQTQLIEDLLDVTRIIAGKLQLENKPFALDKVVRDTLALLQPMVDEQGCRLTFVLQAEPPLAMLGDAKRMQQVVWNLLSNAVKFSSVDGLIEVRLAGVAGSWMLTVKDNGVGINSELLPYLFERFRQADTQRTRAEGGLGIGLSLVKYLVEGHNGTITAASEGEGKGSTFLVRLPAANVAVPGATERPSAKFEPTQKLQSAVDDPQPLAGRKVLLVEDNADSRTGMALLLRRIGATVKSVDDVESALKAGDEFDLLLSDIGLPDRDGCDLIAELRKRPAWQGRPALAISAYALPEDRERALSSGFDDFVVKPIDPEALIQSLKARLRGRASANPST